MGTLVEWGSGVANGCGAKPCGGFDGINPRLNDAMAFKPGGSCEEDGGFCPRKLSTSPPSVSNKYYNLI